MLDNSLVLNISSIAAFAPHPQNVGLLCHKGLCSGTVKALHDELQPRGINVTDGMSRPHGYGFLERG